MAFRFVGVSVPGPGDVLDTARSVAGWGARTLDTVAALPERTEALLSAVEQLIGRIDALSRRAGWPPTRRRWSGRPGR